MSNRIRYSDEPLDLEVVEDFLPPPEDLVRTEDTVKVTLNLTRSSVRFFKEQAQKHGAPYQQMIRRLLDLYAAKHR